VAWVLGRVAVVLGIIVVAVLFGLPVETLRSSSPSFRERPGWRAQPGPARVGCSRCPAGARYA
jgi:hypothetical protein